jgi:hypothetical protein
MVYGFVRCPQCGLKANVRETSTDTMRTCQACRHKFVVLAPQIEHAPAASGCFTGLLTLLGLSVATWSRAAESSVISVRYLTTGSRRLLPLQQCLAQRFRLRSHKYDRSSQGMRSRLWFTTLRFRRRTASPTNHRHRYPSRVHRHFPRATLGHRRWEVLHGSRVC